MDNGAENYRRFLRGDEDGMARIVREYKDGLILFLQKSVGDIHTAEEVAEETFFRLLVKKPFFSGRSSFRSWLYAVGRHAAVDFVRKSARLPALSAEEMEEILRDEADLERDYIKEEQKILVHKALKKLPPDYGQVLWLAYFEDLPNGEVCRVMKKSARQVRNLLYRAKQSLKTELEKEGFVYEEF